MGTNHILLFQDKVLFLHTADLSTVYCINTSAEEHQFETNSHDTLSKLCYHKLVCESDIVHYQTVIVKLLSKHQLDSPYAQRND